MDSPVQRLVGFCISAWIILFVLHRFVMLREAWQEHYELWKDDRFVAEEICRNVTLRANLGLQYESICHDATVGANVWPITRAVKHVIDQTHLCGDISCLDILDHILELLSKSMVWTLACVVLVLMSVLAMFVCAFSKKPSPKRPTLDVETCRLAIGDETYEPYFNQAPPTPKKCKYI